MKVSKKQLLIIALLISVSLSLYWLLKPGLEVRPIPPTIVGSEVGEKQIIAITSKCQVIVGIFSASPLFGY